MAIVELVMPKMGESIMEATILRWHKKPGDQVKSDETILEIATDKVDSEVPSIADGEITEILYAENDVVPVGAVIARIKTNVEAAASAPATAPEAPVQPQQQAEVEVVKPQVEVHEPQFTTAAGPRFYSPLVLTIAQQEGIGFAELEKIPGTGNEGRVTKKDILNYVESKAKGFVPTATPMPAKAGEAPVGQEQASAPAAQKTAQPQAQPQTPSQPQPQAPQVQVPVQPQTTASSNGHAVSYSGAHEIIEMDRMRKLIADHMMKSVQTNAHVTSFAEADVTNIVRWREQEKKIFEKREGEKITFTPLFIEALVKCLKKYPLLNSSLEGDKIIIKKDINVGMAAALPTGNLIVPVIRNADQLNLVGLTKQVNQLANAARNNKLKPEDTQNGTITLTNVGNFGSLAGTPIINMPQVAILAVGTIKKRPVVIETEHGDTIAIRHMMYLSMSYDHRIIDGALGSTFLSAVVHELEHFDVHREY